MGVADLFARPGFADFFRAVAADAVVHVSRLDVGEVVAAANLGLIFRGRYYHVLASYENGPTARFGPGVAHLRCLMRYAIEQGCNLFDFTIGDEPYKREWSDTEMALYDHHSAVTWRGWFVSLLTAVLARVKRTIKQTPALWKLFTRLRARLAGRMGERSG